MRHVQFEALCRLSARNGVRKPMAICDCRLCSDNVNLISGHRGLEMTAEQLNEHKLQGTELQQLMRLLQYMRKIAMLSHFKPPVCRDRWYLC